MLYLSKLLSRDYVYDAVSLTTTLTLHGVRFQYVLNTRDIWLRDFMPVQTRTRQLVSFRYEPSYLTKFPKLRTDFRRDIAQSFGCSVVQCHLGGEDQCLAGNQGYYAGLRNGQAS